MTKPRVKLPESTKVGEVIEIKTLISHVMETGQRKDPDGKTIPRRTINSFAANEVFAADMHPGISPNPYLSFFMKEPGTGEFEFTWIENGGKKFVEKQKLSVATDIETALAVGMRNTSSVRSEARLPPSSERTPRWLGTKRICFQNRSQPLERNAKLPPGFGGRKADPDCVRYGTANRKEATWNHHDASFAGAPGGLVSWVDGLKPNVWRRNGLALAATHLPRDKAKTGFRLSALPSQTAR